MVVAGQAAAQALREQQIQVVAVAVDWVAQAVKAAAA
jgi:hypothetical protein